MKALLLAMLLVGLTGCGPTLPPVPEPAPAPDTAQLDVPIPAEIEIPAIGVTSSLVPEGLQPDGTLDVPPVTMPQQAGWYSDGIRPGAIGAAVVMGHVSGRPPGSSKSVPGVFAKLAQLKAGDEVTIRRGDGSAVVFAVRSQILVSKAAFPVEAVYGDTAAPELRLITCGGVFDPAAHSYRSNVVVFLDLKGTP